MKQVKKDFIPDFTRYPFDFKYCSTHRGWAQLDSGQDAPYYGNWLNPFLRRIIEYAEGDVITSTFDSDEELLTEVLKIEEWNIKQGYGQIRLDPGFNLELREKLVDIGMEALM